MALKYDDSSIKILVGLEAVNEIATLPSASYSAFLIVTTKVKDKRSGVPVSDLNQPELAPEIPVKLKVF